MTYNKDFKGKSLIKIFEYLKNKDLVSLSQIAKDCGLNFYTVRSAIDCLAGLNKVEILTAGKGKVKLIRLKEGGKNGNS